MADKAGLGMIGMLLCAATLFVIVIGGIVVRATLNTGVGAGNTYGLQALSILDAPRLRTVAAE